MTFIPSLPLKKATCAVRLPILIFVAKNIPKKFTHATRAPLFWKINGYMHFMHMIDNNVTLAQQWNKNN